MSDQQVNMSDTLREIGQQPSLWKKTIVHFSKKVELLNSFLRDIERQHKRVRVIFTGAGSSAFVGETLYPHIRREINQRGWDAECISTTNLTSTPDLFLDENVPTIIVSFARSGNSPESLSLIHI